MPHGAFINDFLQEVADFVPAFQHIRQHGLANHIAQCCLGCPTDGALIVRHIQRRPFWVHHFPKQHGIHIHRHCISCESLFRLESSRDDTGIDPVRNRVDDRNDEKQSRPPEGVEMAQTQYDHPIPLGSNLDCGRNRKGDYERADSNSDGSGVSANPIHGIGQCRTHGQYENKDQARKRFVWFHVNRLPHIMFITLIRISCYETGKAYAAMQPHGYGVFTPKPF